MGVRRRFVNLRIPDGGNTTRAAEIVVRDGTIEAVLPAAHGVANSDPEAETVDLGNALVLPGVIDGHVHFDDPGFTHREDFGSGTRAAAAGGVTCVVDMPCTSLPPVTTEANLRTKLAVIEPKAHVDFMLWGGVSGNAIAEPDWSQHLGDLVEAGVASIKVYMLSGMDTFTDLGAEQIRDVLDATARLGIPVGVHAEDRAMVRALTEKLQAAGRNGPLDYAASRPAAAELSAISTMLELCGETGAHVHIVHLATGAGVDLVAAARDQGLPCSAETCPQYLAFTVTDLAQQGAKLKTAPVVKSAADRDRLWRGLAAGEIEYVATDHAAGQWPAEKHSGSIWTDYGGVPGVELSLPYLYSAGVRGDLITLQRLVEITASAPARFFGIDDRKGRLEPGFDADLAVLDDAARWTVRAVHLHNLNRYTPLEGRALCGRVRATYVRGRCVFERSGDGTETFGAPGSGRWIRRSNWLR